MSGFQALAVAAALLAGPLASPVAGAQGDAERAKLQLSLPADIGTLKFENHHEFEDPALGVSVAYGARGQVLTIYLYNMGLRGIPDGIHNEVVQEHYQQVTEDVTDSEAYEEVTIRHEGITPLADGANQPEVLEAEFRIVRKDGPALTSYLMLTAAGGIFVKVRYSVGEGAELEATANRNAILTALKDMLPTIHMIEED